MKTAELRSVIYREGKLTRQDYEEAISALQTALDQGNITNGYCSVCSSQEHQAENCHHNPLVMARRAARWAFTMENSIPWRCFHCGQVFKTVREAQEHFGTREQDYAACHKSQTAKRLLDARLQCYTEAAALIRDEWSSALCRERILAARDKLKAK